MPAPDIFDLNTLAWGLAVLCALLVGFAKSGLPAAGVIIVPLMANIFPAGMSRGILLPMLIVGDLFAIGYYRRHASP